MTKKHLDKDLAALKSGKGWKKVQLPPTPLKNIQLAREETDEFENFEQLGKYIYISKEEELMDEAGSWTNETISTEIIGEINGEIVNWLFSRLEATNEDGRDYIRQPNYIEGLFSFFTFQFN